MKYIKEELEKLIFEDNLSYEEIGRKYEVSGTYIKKISSKLGITLPIRAKFPEGFEPFNKGKRKVKSIGERIVHSGKNKGELYVVPEPVFCEHCGKQCDVYAKKYCSIKCQSEVTSKNKYKDFLENNEKYCRASFNPKSIKKWILQEQDYKCAICGIENNWNGKELVFVLDHIDGNAANNKRENLRCVCPNCDSQLDTFKSKNKNSARKERYLLNYKNI